MQDHYNNWNKQWEKLGKSLIKITSQLSGLVLKDNLRDMKDMFAKFDLISNSIDFDKHLKTYKMLQNVDFSQLLGISEQIKMISSVDISGMTTVLQQFADNEFLRGLKSSSIISAGYDLQRLARIMQNSLEQVNWSQDVSVDVITEEVAEQYVEDILKEGNNQQSLETQTKQANKEKIKNEIAFWVTIISFIITIYSLVNSKPQVTNNTYNNIIEVNNNYTIDCGVDAEFMNEMGYRIINQNDVMPRIKPDCSSMVTGHLYIGQIVSVSDKYRKWVKITWKNDDGDFCSGWVQNYKVSKFK